MANSTIEDVMLAFAEWRSQRTSKTQTPDHLKTMALSLLENHSKHEVCKRLSLNSKMLKCWRGWQPKQQVPPNGFVTLNTKKNEVIQEDAMALSFSTKSGVDCRLSGQLDPSFVARVLQGLQA